MAKTGLQIAEDLQRLLLGEKVGETLHGLLLTLQSVLCSADTPAQAEALAEKFFQEFEASIPQIKDEIEKRSKPNNGATPQVH